MEKDKNRMSRALAHSRKKGFIRVAQSSGEAWYIDTNRVIFIYSEDKWATIFCKDCKTYITSQSVKSICEKNEDFILMRRGRAINKKYIRAVRKVSIKNRYYTLVKLWNFAKEFRTSSRRYDNPLDYLSEKIGVDEIVLDKEYLSGVRRHFNDRQECG